MNKFFSDDGIGIKYINSDQSGSDRADGQTPQRRNIMATVPITKRIISYVSAQLADLFAERIANIEEQIHEMDPADRWYDENVSERQQRAITTLLEPPPFLNTYSTVTYIIEAVGANICRDQTLLPPRPLPASTRVHAWSEARQIRINPDTTPIFYSEIAPLLNQRAALIKERNTLIENLVEGVLNRHTTLSKVLRVWPSALEFMPPEVVQRHNEKSAHTKDAPKGPVVITDDIKASLIAARLAKGS